MQTCGRIEKKEIIIITLRLIRALYYVPTNCRKHGGGNPNKLLLSADTHADPLSLIFKSIIIFFRGRFFFK